MLPGIMLTAVANHHRVFDSATSTSTLYLQIMEVASPTAGSVLVELSQLQLMQVCREVAVRTMSPHGESADSIPAPVPPALVAACLPATVSCPSPRPGSEARPPLAPASPGPGDPGSPLRRPDPHGTREPPGAPPASPPREAAKGSPEEPPAPCSQVPCWGEGEQVEAGTEAEGLGPSSVPTIPGGGWGSCAGHLRGREGPRASCGRESS